MTQEPQEPTVEEVRRTAEGFRPVFVDEQRRVTMTIARALLRRMEAEAETIALVERLRRVADVHHNGYAVSLRGVDALVRDADAWLAARKR